MTNAQIREWWMDGFDSKGHMGDYYGKPEKYFSKIIRQMQNSHHGYLFDTKDGDPTPKEISTAFQENTEGLK